MQSVETKLMQPSSTGGKIYFAKTKQWNYNDMSKILLYVNVCIALYHKWASIRPLAVMTIALSLSLVPILFYCSNKNVFSLLSTEYMVVPFHIHILNHDCFKGRLSFCMNIHSQHALSLIISSVSATGTSTGVRQLDHLVEVRKRQRSWINKKKNANADTKPGHGCQKQMLTHNITFYTFTFSCSRRPCHCSPYSHRI